MCHVSVGHAAREIEASGISTVTVFVKSFRHIAESMGVPRTVITAHPMGRPMGASGDRGRQTAVLNDSLRLLESACCGGETLESDGWFLPKGSGNRSDR